jgi:hypothetical protein
MSTHQNLHRGTSKHARQDPQDGFEETLAIE